MIGIQHFPLCSSYYVILAILIKMGTFATFKAGRSLGFLPSFDHSSYRPSTWHVGPSNRFYLNSSIPVPSFSSPTNFWGQVQPRNSEDYTSSLFLGTVNASDNDMGLAISTSSFINELLTSSIKYTHGLLYLHRLTFTLFCILICYPS